MLLQLDKIQELFPEGKVDRRGKNWITNCPECGNREFSISLSDNHPCGCFRHKECGFRSNVFGLMKKIGRVDILVNKDIKFDKIEKVKLVKEEHALDLELPDINIPMGWKRIYQDDYLESRGFDAYDRYKVGVSNIHPQLADEFLIFLIEEENRLKGYIARSRKSKKEIDKLNSYYKSKGSQKKVLRYSNSLTDFGKLVYGLDEITEATKILIIVEGIFDKFNIDRLFELHGQKEIVCVCTFKCAVSPEQIYKIQQRGVNIETTILLYDPDVIDDIKKAAFDLRSYMGNILIGFADSGNDPGDFTMDDVEQVFNTLKTPSQFNIERINVKMIKL